MKTFVYITLSIFFIGCSNNNPYPHITIDKLQLKNADETMKKVFSKFDYELSTHEYLDEYKSFTYAIDSDGAYALGWSSSKKNQKEANKIAMKLCNESRQEYNVENKCRVYMEGSKVVKPLLSPFW